MRFKARNAKAFDEARDAKIFLAFLFLLQMKNYYIALEFDSAVIIPLTRHLRPRRDYEDISFKRQTYEHQINIYKLLCIIKY